MTLTLGGSTMDILMYLFILTIQYIKVQRTFEIALSESWLALSIAYFYQFAPHIKSGRFSKVVLGFWNFVWAPDSQKY